MNKICTLNPCNSPLARMMAMAKKYPLKILELFEFEGPLIGYYSKGHHETSKFLYEVLKEAHGNPMGDCRVMHYWWRNIPVIGDPEARTVFYPAQQNTRGSYPVTVFYL